MIEGVRSLEDEIVEALDNMVPSEDCCENSEARSLLHMLSEDHPDFNRLFTKFMRRVYGTDSGC